MDLPKEVLNIFKCGECDEYLSCGPVYTQHKNELSICGRCTKLSETQKNMNDVQLKEEYPSEPDKTRNVLYEAAASLFIYPCRFYQYGCPEKIRFTSEPNKHETTCNFKPYVCPVEPINQCDWIGPWDDLLQHCTEVHPQQIIHNPAFLPRPNLNLSNIQTFLLPAFGHLFLVHVKTCINSAMLYHSVRLLGDPTKAPFYQFCIIIDGGKKIKDSSVVLPPGNLVIQDHTALKTPINGLLPLVGKYDGTKFSIKISKMEQCRFCKNIIKIGQPDQTCNSCKHTMKFCENFSNGCAYKDTCKDKCDKHQLYFCKLRVKCSMFSCGAIFEKGAFFSHLSANKCKVMCVFSSIGTVWRADKSHCKFVVLSSSKDQNDMGMVFCQYKLILSQFVLHVWTPLSSNDLEKYQCQVKVFDCGTEHCETVCPDFCATGQDDWTVTLSLANFPSHVQNGYVDIEVNFMKK